MQASMTYPHSMPYHVFRPRTLKMELDVAEALATTGSRAEKVTDVLLAALMSIDDQPVDRTLIRSLSVGSRVWLLFRAAAYFNPGTNWFASCCDLCGEKMDLEINLVDVPVKLASEAFPFISLQTSLGEKRLRLPNGFDEEFMARCEAMEDRELQRMMARRCGLSESKGSDASSFLPADLAALDEAFDAVALQPAESLTVECPSCGETANAGLDPLLLGFPTPSRVLREVHQLALAYHWSEAEILALPRQRYAAYVAMFASRSGNRRRAEESVS